MTLVLIVYFNFYILLMMYVVSKKQIHKASTLRRVLFLNEDYYLLKTDYMKRVVREGLKSLKYGMLLFNGIILLVYLLFEDFYKISGDDITFWLFITSSVFTATLQNIYSGKKLKEIAIEENRELIIDFGNSYLNALLNWKLELGFVLLFAFFFSAEVQPFGFSQNIPFFTIETLFCGAPLLSYIFMRTKKYFTEESYHTEMKGVITSTLIYFMVKIIIVFGTLYVVTVESFWDRTALATFIGLFMCQIYHYTKNIHKLNVLFETKNA